jgi:CheY-like chemotaxis protein
MSSTAHLLILLVEDSEDDLFFFRRLFAKAGIEATLSVATDGQEAIDHLQAAITAGGPLPHLVFLDLKLPLRRGTEVLQWIRAQPQLSRVAVVILSSSAEERDISQTEELGAQGYLVKYPEPVVFRDIVQQVAALPSTAALSSLSLPQPKKR